MRTKTKRVTKKELRTLVRLIGEDKYGHCWKVIDAHKKPQYVFVQMWRRDERAPGLYGEWRFTCATAKKFLLKQLELWRTRGHI